MNTRKNHVDMSAAEKAAFVSAVLALKNKVNSVLNPGKRKRYDDFVQVHKNAMTGPDMFMPMPHGGPLFFPWHRVLLRQFELALQGAVADPNIAVPYWDWELSGKNNPFTDDFMGGDGDAAQGDRVVTGPFAYAKKKFKIRVWDGTSGNSGLLREFGTDPTAYLPTPTQVASALTKTPYWPGANSWENTCEGGLHNPVHRWIGGNMGDATSPNDPVFFCTTATSICSGKSGRSSILPATPICRPPARRAMIWPPSWFLTSRASQRPGRARGKCKIRWTRPASDIHTLDPTDTCKGYEKYTICENHCLMPTGLTRTGRLEFQFEVKSIQTFGRNGPNTH